jgi:hypothetical protein
MSIWIKTVSECIGLYQSKKLRKNRETRKKTRSAAKRKMAWENSVYEIKFFFNVVVYFLRYMDKIVRSIIMFIGLVNGILRAGVKNGNRLCSNMY